MRTPTCHPDKKHYSKGLCESCYKKTIYNYKKVLFKRTNMANNAEYVYSRTPVMDIPDMLKDDYWIRFDCNLPKLIYE